MPTKILDLDLEHLPVTIDKLAPYEQALILCRYRGRPVGQVWLPIVGGRLERRALQNAIAKAADWPIWDCWLQNYLAEDRGQRAIRLPAATVAICTRDRPQDLQRCLAACLRLPDDGQEYLVVDSCSTSPEIKQIVQQYPRVRYIREERPGLNIARNRALREATHAIVAFCDDDATPDSNWLRALTSNFADPLVLCVTGLVMPLELETDAQLWFERYNAFGRGFERQVFDNTKLSPAKANSCGAGASMALRHCVVDQVGFFDEALDAGTPTHSGGDHEMFARILRGGCKIVYEPAALSWHRHRRTWPELRKTVYGYGVGVYAAWTRSLLAEHDFTVLLMAGLWFLRTQLPNLLRSLWRRPASCPTALIWLELCGCLAGPWAYSQARRQWRMHQQHVSR